MKCHLNIDVGQEMKSSVLSKIAVVRSLPGLGDFLCCVPALRSLRTAFPTAEITLIGLAATASLIEQFRHYVDSFLEFPGYPGIPEVSFSAERTTSFLADAQRLKFDLALQLHGSGVCTNGFTLLLGAKQSAGFYPQGGYCPAPNFLPYPDDEPEVWRSLRLLEFLDIPIQGDHLEFPIQTTDWQAWNAIATTYSLRSNYICIHPGASISERRWDYRNFAAIADGLAAQGFQIVLTGAATERELTQTVAQAMHHPAIDLAGQTDLGVLAALLQRSRLLICNDTGISHLAAAVQTNSVVIFSNSDPQRWAPLNRQIHRVVQVSALQGRSSVLAEAVDLLQQEFAYAS